MKNYILILFLLFSVNLSAQHKFAWITDTHVGYEPAAGELESVVMMINSFDDLDFVIASGDITEKGRNSELEEAKSILDKLNKPLYIIPGNHDTKWSESGCTKFAELWDDDKFIFELNDYVYIGLNSGIPWKGGGGHLKPNDLNWLKNELSEIDTTKEVFFVVHHPLNEDIDNWFEATNILRNYNIKAILYGHGHQNKITKFNEIPAAQSRSTLSKGKDSWGFTLVDNQTDKLVFYEVERDSLLNPWGSIDKTQYISVPEITFPQFNNFKTEIIWQNDLNYTVSALPLVWNSKVYVADISGILTCFDSTGAIIWDYDTFGNVYSKPAIKDGVLAVATIQGDLTTLNAETGEQIQSMGFDDAITAPLTIFDFKGERNLLMPKRTNSDAAIILGTASGLVYCYDLETLQELWVNTDAEGMIEAEPLLIGNKFIYGSWDTHLYCIDTKGGTTIWKWQESKSFYYSPAVCIPITDGKKIYIATPDKYLYAIDLRLGNTLWKKKKYNTWESLGISNDKRKLYVKSFKDHFHIVSAITSNWVKDINMKFGIDTMPTVPIEWNSNILFGAKDGHVYMIDKKNKFKPILFLGTARVHSVQRISDGIFLASNMDGNIVVFNLPKNN